MSNLRMIVSVFKRIRERSVMNENSFFSNEKILRFDRSSIAVDIMNRRAGRAFFVMMDKVSPE